MLFLPAYGFQRVSGFIVSNCIGANNLPLAKSFFRVIFCSAVAMVCCISFVLFLGKTQIIAAFTRDVEV